MRTFPWAEVPHQLRLGLLAGGTGRSHLAGLARGSLAASRVHAGSPERSGFLARLGFDLLLAAWEEDALNGALAHPLLTLGDSALPPTVRNALRWLVEHWRPEARTERLANRGDLQGLRQLLEQRTQAQDPHLLRAVVEVLLLEGEPADILSFISQFAQNPDWLPEPTLRTMLSADLYAVVEPGMHVDRLSALAEELPLAGMRERLAHALYRSGDPERALSLWRGVLEARPWNVNLALRSRDVLLGRDQEFAPLAGGCSILLYSWNKQDDLHRALTALEAAATSDFLRETRVVVLDNGSTDQTPETLRNWCGRWGRDRFEHVRLDVNVGAPAARNWLLAREDVRSRRWTVFLDDDALVPSGWFERLGAAARRYPDAQAWGCTVVDAGRPWVLQSADLHLRVAHTPEPGTEPRGQTPALPVTDLQHQGFDLGRFDSLRCCASVTGCCHLFRTRSLVERGGFDIRYSPSQFDDLDCDLRAVAQGGYTVCQGWLRVEHLKRSGVAARRAKGAAGNGEGNLVKLRSRFSDRDVQRMATELAQRQEDELQRAHADLTDAWESGACP
ncbi:hypothetical protein SAMN02745704_02598 [Paucidesulfovibrio gracilis DSM 16080]|uniref:Glycosyltransferase 2-like domain-containing protein n=1 Tax=Paucidesulfovibrio gracilis DSM 16080 TaxID=1121449 RepID=A0A1T4XZK3_9BACT|nr:glycosyltransferase [Paucidesulfovibrio gracilis]SKA94648.1 hypothetical protein SAMN02745704_02598 [Paucidesulfovibrio gracilis DSM 16080]